MRLRLRLILHITYISLEEPNINEFFPMNKAMINSKFNKISEKKLSEIATYTYWGKNEN